MEITLVKVMMQQCIEAMNDLSEFQLSSIGRILHVRQHLNTQTSLHVCVLPESALTLQRFTKIEG